jgi:hypothetical protein
MNFQVFDMMGAEIHLDDIIVGAFSYGSSAALRVGKVVELKITYPQYTQPNYYVRVRWLHGYGLPDKPTLIGVKPNDKCHLMKVSIDGIN